MPALRLTALHCTLLVIDVQERLLPAIHRPDRLMLNLEFLVDAAALAGVQCRVTEQYPQGLGPTVPALAAKLPPQPLSKKSFSCCGAEGLVESLNRESRPCVLLCGMESHVCVSQTAIGLLDRNFQVALAEDAIAARDPHDHDIAMRRLSAAGAVLTTVEAVGFEWLRRSDHPSFKAYSKLVQERARRLRELPQ